ncbi:hypothetical protein BaRGS_00009035 [Batillaria attramentaria]|uniref:Uncharacterized protein n=1 Tax=Batillaria attramentaria TaxID=370345 RepID=A0ABD0LJK2_9CAEN
MVLPFHCGYYRFSRIIIQRQYHNTMRSIQLRPSVKLLKQESDRVAILDTVLAGKTVTPLRHLPIITGECQCAVLSAIPAAVSSNRVSGKSVHLSQCKKSRKPASATYSNNL